jgi:hypothetical protein
MKGLRKNTGESLESALIFDDINKFAY